jgi:hypothetical protein
MGKPLSFWAALCALALLAPSFINAQDLSLSPADLRIELRPDGGYHLFLRYKPDISSVLLTESTRDPTFRAENYAYRTAERNAVNGNEIRLINGFPIPLDSKIYSLVSSTPERHPELGWAYHIYIPHTLLYGYEGGRHGEVQVGDGTYLNIRAFYYAYADYRGAFKDNPFIIRVAQEEKPPETTGTFLKETVDAFFQIAGENTEYSSGPGEMVDRIWKILKKEENKKVDLVICLDVTGSMKPYFDAIRQQLIPNLQEIVAEYESFRIGMVFFKDYRDEFLTKVFPFTTDFNLLQRNVDTVKVGGGGDIPEAVFEALHDGATKLAWNAESKIMILIGDAPPHPRPRGKITRQMVDRETSQRGIKLHAIILPQ